MSMCGFLGWKDEYKGADGTILFCGEHLLRAASLYEVYKQLEGTNVFSLPKDVVDYCIDLRTELQANLKSTGSGHEHWLSKLKRFRRELEHPWTELDPEDYVFSCCSQNFPN